MEVYALFPVKCSEGVVALHLEASDMLPKGPPDLEVFWSHGLTFTPVFMGSTCFSMNSYWSS